MGLDMYLFKTSKRGRPRLDKHGEQEKETVVTWRKANQIHNWFVDKLSLPDGFNCETAEVSKEILEELVNICNLVLSVKEHCSAEVALSVAENNLPRRAGFFFGDYDYGDWYYNDLIYTLDKINKVLEETDWDSEKIFYSCWW